MILDIYYKKKLGIPFVTIIFFITCCIVTVPTYFDNNLYYVFANRSKPVYFWQVFSGTFEHTIFNNPPLLIHFIGNMVFLCVIGVLCERILGNFKFFLLVIGGMAAAALELYLTASAGVISTNAGTSGIVYTFPPIILYALFILWGRNKAKLMREKMFYLIIFLFGFMYVFISMFSPISTNRAHFIATIVGTIYLVIWRKHIKSRVLNHVNPDEGDGYSIKAADKIAIILSVIFFAMMTTLLVVNYTIGYEKLFFNIINSTTEYRVEEINTNQNRIVLGFDEAVSGEISLASHLNSEEPLSIDAKLMPGGLSYEILFSRTLIQGKDYGSFVFYRTISNKGKILKTTEITFK